MVSKSSEMRAYDSMAKLNYLGDFEFNVTFDNGSESEPASIPTDGTALVSSPNGEVSAVVAFPHHDGALIGNTVYTLVPLNTTVTGEVPTEEEMNAYIETEDDEDEDEDVDIETEFDDDDELDDDDSDEEDEE